VTQLCPSFSAILSCREAPSQWGNELKIYTRAGDSGETGLYGGARVQKDAERVEAYGTIDELNAHLGLAVARLTSDALMSDVVTLLTRIQSQLFDIGAELATPPDRAQSKLTGRITVTDSRRVEALEIAIDTFETRLQPLKTFILPGGSEAAAALHIARTVARRAERRVVTLSRGEPVNPEILKYLNRLSDLLFVVARAANLAVGIKDVAWDRGLLPASDSVESAR
jgi:cob(I)alamin adenosyltransferase